MSVVSTPGKAPVGRVASRVRGVRTFGHDASRQAASSSGGA